MEDLVVEALPWLEGVVDTVQVAVSAIPDYLEEAADTVQVAVSAIPSYLEGAADTAQVVVSAIPRYGEAIVTSPWFMGSACGGFLVWTLGEVG